MGLEPIHPKPRTSKPHPAHKIRITMDGRGRCLDNVFVERLWRSLKYEEVYLHLHAYEDAAAAKAGIGAWMRFYDALLQPGTSPPGA